MANRRATNGGISRMNGRIFTTNGSPRGTIWNLRGKTLPLFINKRNPYILNTASVSLYAIAQSVRNYPPVRRAPCRGRPFMPSGGDQRRVGADAADDRADRADLPKTGPERGVHRCQRDRRQRDRLPAGYGRCAADRAVIARPPVVHAVSPSSPPRFWAGASSGSPSCSAAATTRRAAPRPGRPASGCCCWPWG